MQSLELHGVVPRAMLERGCMYLKTPHLVRGPQIQGVALVVLDIKHFSKNPSSIQRLQCWLTRILAVAYRVLRRCTLRPVEIFPAGSEPCSKRPRGLWVAFSRRGEREDMSDVQGLRRTESSLPALLRSINLAKPPLHLRAHCLGRYVHI